MNPQSYVTNAHARIWRTRSIRENGSFRAGRGRRANLERFVHHGFFWPEAKDQQNCDGGGCNLQFATTWALTPASVSAACVVN
jgi:hypothetical protein